MYSVEINKNLIKLIEKMNEPTYTQIKTAVLDLAVNPRPFGYIKLRNREAFRIRIGKYRILYEINESEKSIKVVDIGHRKNIYL